MSPTMESTDPTLEDVAQTLSLPDEEVEGRSLEAAGPSPTAKCVIDLSKAESEKLPKGEEMAEGEESASDCVEMVDAEPMIMDPRGQMVPVGGSEPSTAALVEQRLQERRLEIEQMASEAESKQAILDAAEKRIEERAAELEELENRVIAAVDAEEEAAAKQLKAMISVYEGMKPAAAATIFDEMPHDGLVLIVKDMNPRKIAPILAKMKPETASDLTVHLAGLPSPTP
ncbi:MAG: MotE family protein [Devosia sp.]